MKVDAYFEFAPSGPHHEIADDYTHTCKNVRLAQDAGADQSENWVPVARLHLPSRDM